MIDKNSVGYVKIEGCGEKDIIPVGEGVMKLEGAS
jgi:hypothetical protein